MDENQEIYVKMSICPKEKFLALASSCFNSHKASKIVLYEVKPEKLKFKRWFDVRKYNTKSILALEFLGYKNDLVGLIGLNDEERSKMFSLVYHTKKEKKLVLGFRKTELGHPACLKLFGNKLFGIDWKLRLFDIEGFKGV